MNALAQFFGVEAPRSVSDLESERDRILEQSACNHRDLIETERQLATADAPPKELKALRDLRDTLRLALRKAATTLRRVDEELPTALAQVCAERCRELDSQIADATARVRAQEQLLAAARTGLGALRRSRASAGLAAANPPGSYLAIVTERRAHDPAYKALELRNVGNPLAGERERLEPLEVEVAAVDRVEPVIETRPPDVAWREAIAGRLRFADPRRQAAADALREAHL